MTAKDLIEELQKADPEAEVIIWDWNGGDEKHNYTQPTLDPSRFEGIFMLNRDLSYQGKITLKA